MTQLIDYLKAAKSPYHAVEFAAKRLKEAGFEALDFTKKIETAVSFKKGDKVKVKSGAVVYGTNDSLSSFVYRTIFHIIEISGSRAVIGINGQVTTAIDKKYLTKV